MKALEYWTGFCSQMKMMKIQTTELKTTRTALWTGYSVHRVSGAQSEEQVSSLRGGFKSRPVFCFGFRANKMSNLLWEGNARSEKHLEGQSSTPDKEIGVFFPRQTIRLGVKDFDQLLLWSFIQPTASSCKTRTSILNRPRPLTQRKILRPKIKI